MFWKEPKVIRYNTVLNTFSFVKMLNLIALIVVWSWFVIIELQAANIKLFRETFAESEYLICFLPTQPMDKIRLDRAGCLTTEANSFSDVLMPIVCWTVDLNKQSGIHHPKVTVNDDYNLNSRYHQSGFFWGKLYWKLRGVQTTLNSTLNGKKF